MRYDAMNRTAGRSILRWRWLGQFAWRDLALVGVPALALVIGGFWLAAQYIRPAPPDTLRVATGTPSGAYSLYAARYRPGAEDLGFHIAEIATAGAVENLRRLRAGEVDFGFVQGGIGAGINDDNLLSLGALYYEPLWVFHARGARVQQFRDLAGRRIAIGAEGSGTRALALSLLEAYGIAAPPTRLSPLGGTAAVAALEHGEVDAIMLVGAHRSAAIWLALFSSRATLLSLADAPAYARHFPFLTPLTLPRGAIDLARVIPERDIALVGTPVQMVAHADSHPAHVDLMLQAMRAVHASPGLFEAAGEFPAPRLGDFPVHPRAQRFYQSGPPFLQRYLPFRVANLVDRTIVLLLPFIALLLPMLRYAPQLYGWRVQRRMNRWYGELKFLERDAWLASDPSAREVLNARLDALEEAVNRLSVPLAYSDHYYHLRAHIRLVRDQIDRRMAQRL